MSSLAHPVEELESSQDINPDDLNEHIDLNENTETFFYHNGFDDYPVRDEEDEDHQMSDEPEPFEFVAEYDGTERNPDLIKLQALELNPQTQNQVKRPSSSLPTLPRNRGRRANSASQRIQSQISLTDLYEKAREKAKRKVQSQNDVDLGVRPHSSKRSRFGIGATMRRDRDENEDQNQGMRVEGSSSGVQSKENRREPPIRMRKWVTRLHCAQNTIFISFSLSFLFFFFHLLSSSELNERNLLSNSLASQTQPSSASSFLFFVKAQQEKKQEIETQRWREERKLQEQKDLTIESLRIELEEEKKAKEAALLEVQIEKESNEKLEKKVQDLEIDLLNTENRYETQREKVEKSQNLVKDLKSKMVEVEESFALEG